MCYWPLPLLSVFLFASFLATDGIPFDGTAYKHSGRRVCRPTDIPHALQYTNARPQEWPRRSWLRPAGVPQVCMVCTYVTACAAGLKPCPLQMADLTCNGVRDPLHLHCDVAPGPKNALFRVNARHVCPATSSPRRGRRQRSPGHRPSTRRGATLRAHQQRVGAYASFEKSACRTPHPRRATRHRGGDGLVSCLAGIHGLPVKGRQPGTA